MELNCVTLVRRALANPLLAAATWMSDVYALTATTGNDIFTGYQKYPVKV
jgi:hypothetical protein